VVRIRGLRLPEDHPERLASQHLLAQVQASIASPILTMVSQ
jgi:hypothetical protein